MRVFISTESRFEYIDFLGKTAKEMLDMAFQDEITYIDNDKEIVHDGEYAVLLYQDTPLVDKQFLSELAEKGANFKLGDGYIIQKGYIGELKEIEDVRAKQIKTLADVPIVCMEIKKKLKKRYDKKDILFYDFNTCYIDQDVEIADGCIIHPMVTLKGKTKLGRNCVIFSHTELVDTEVAENVDIRSSYSVGAMIGAYTTVGPFACLRAGAKIGAYCRIGDFVEIKDSVIGDNTKMAHLAYVGDSTVGHNTNIGCGAVFANYDGKVKQGCTVGNNVFIGANSNLVAPVTVHDGAFIAAGSTVTHDVPGGNLCIARSRQVLKEDWGKR